MSAPVNVLIHPSQFPENVHDALFESLRRREVHHKFHYDSYKQAEKWLELHEAYSPSRTDPQCAMCYEESFAAAAKLAHVPTMHVVGLGAGGGQKDARLLQVLRESRKHFRQAGATLLSKRGGRIAYTPVDSSLALVLTAQRAASRFVSKIDPLVCDLSTADDLPDVLAECVGPGTVRVLTFFGMMPNFEPDLALSKLAPLVRPGDLLLVSANLAPGEDYAAGVHQVQPGYDNALTNDWLMTFLLDLGIERTDGVLQWTIEPCPSIADLLRLTARFYFRQSRTVRVMGEEFCFKASENIRLFFSYRYTPQRLRELFSKYGLLLKEQWVTSSGEEGVFLCGRN